MRIVIHSPTQTPLRPLGPAAKSEECDQLWGFFSSAFSCTRPPRKWKGEVGEKGRRGDKTIPDTGLSRLRSASCPRLLWPRTDGAPSRQEPSNARLGSCQLGLRGNVRNSTDDDELSGRATYRKRYQGSLRGRSRAARWRRTCRRTGHAWGRLGLVNRQEVSTQDRAP